METQYAKIEVYAPTDCLDSICKAVNEAAADENGHYDMVCSYHLVTGSWRPLAGSVPYLGEPGVLCTAEEYKIEFRCLAAQLADVVRAIRAVHPYEEPVINCIPLLGI